LIERRIVTFGQTAAKRLAARRFSWNESHLKRLAARDTVTRWHREANDGDVRVTCVEDGSAIAGSIGRRLL